jgi:hypothetical protein
VETTSTTLSPVSPRWFRHAASTPSGTMACWRPRLRGVARS